MSDRPRYLVAADKLTRILAGSESEELRCISPLPLQEGALINADLFTPEGATATGVLVVKSFSPHVAEGSGAAVLRIVSATLVHAAVPIPPAPTVVETPPSAPSVARAASSSSLSTLGFIGATPATASIARALSSSSLGVQSPVAAKVPSSTSTSVQSPFPATPAVSPALAKAPSSTSLGTQPPEPATPAVSPAVAKAPSSTSLGTQPPVPATPAVSPAVAQAPSSTSLASQPPVPATPAVSASVARAPSSTSVAKAVSSPSMGVLSPAVNVKSSTSTSVLAPAGSAKVASSSSLGLAAVGAGGPDVRRHTELFTEFTRQLVKLLGRPNHDAGQVKVRDEEALNAAYTLLTELIGDRAELGYVLERQGDATDLFIDGIGHERRKVSTVLKPEISETFVPRLVVYLEIFQLVMLVFRKGITRAEWADAVDVLSGLHVPDAARDLATELAIRKLVHVSALTVADLAGKESTIPWQQRIALVRLVRDIKTQPRVINGSPEDAAAHRRSIVLDVLRPFGTPPQLKSLLVHCSVVQELADKIPALEAQPLEEVLANVLEPAQQLAVAQGLLDDVKAHRFPDPAFDEDRARSVLKRLALKLAGGASADITTLLRAAHDEKILAYAELPQDLREWVDAEALARAEDPAAQPQSSDHGEHWRRVLVKTTGLLFREQKADKGTALLLRLQELCGTTGEHFVAAMEDGLPALLQRYCTGTRADRESLVPLLTAVNTKAAPAAMELLLAAGDQAPANPAFQLLQVLGTAAMPAVREALVRKGHKPGSLRALLMLAVKLADPESLTPVRTLLKHPDARVRAQALTTVAALMGPGARPAFVDAVVDAEPSVAAHAFELLVLRKEGFAEADVAALAVLTKAGVPVATLVAALRYASVSTSADLHASVGGLVDREQAGGGLRRLLKTGGPNRPEVLAAACAVLGVARDDVRLGKLAKHTDATVRSAAELALAARRQAT